MRLGEILVRRGWVAQAQVDEALARQRTVVPRRRLGELLRDRSLLTDLQLAEALAEQSGVSWTGVVEEGWLAPELLRDVSVDWARQNLVLPVRVDGAVRILTADPTRIDVQQDVAILLGREADLLVTTEGMVRKAIEQAFTRRRVPAAVGETTEGAPAAPDRSREDAPAGGEDLLRSAQDAPVTQWLNTLLLDGVRERASDIHLEPFRQRMQVRFRVDGVMYERPAPPRAMEAAIVSRVKIMAKLDIAERRLPQDGMAGVRVGDREIDIRVSTVPVAEGERVVLRLLNRSSTLMPLSGLGMPEAALSGLRGILRQSNGILLVTGPTGSGKTTTLYATLQELDRSAMNILTIEDPIEYQLPGIGQIQVRPKIGLTFAQGLRHILRQDPDVILIGEIRDPETAEIAVRASMTGHLVLSTLHTNDAPSAVMRLVDMGVEPYLLASTLRGVMAQRLVRRLCPACKRRVDDARGTHWVATGCAECLGGYRERTGVYEFCTISESMQDAIRTARSPREIAAASVGMQHMAEDAAAKVREGVTSIDEVERVLGIRLP